MTEKRYDNVKRLAERGLVSFTSMTETSHNGPGARPTVVHHVNERDSYVVVAQLSPEFTARLVGQWQKGGLVAFTAMQEPTQRVSAILLSPMTSREIAELTGKQHAHVLRDARTTLSELGLTESSFGSSYQDSTGRSLPQLSLPKRETLILVSGYSVTMRAKIIDRWQELEAVAVPAIPKTYSGMLRLAAERAEQIEAAQAQIAHMTPLATVGSMVSQHKHTLA
ncbi:Rha family transcriptional regulator [Xylophilus sp. GOD-11R]|uniref:Rha family transcriptional regulator n=1 Tax=Xylophilus sp. GOD-11R TaxID=3089814 RepID=UPI00298CA07E|nr:Rha family transcriptional regulator [Xylophilus sp. GOD-11R]WPB57673.1 Rha family transcriptional regulator [Xylophilus sp. GOD-11R]